jgi:hypothetical protein
MLDFSTATIESITVHYIGSKSNGEHMRLSPQLLKIKDERMEEILLRFFLNPFANPEFNAFTFSNDDFYLNPLFKYSCEMFDDEDTFESHSVNIAKHLFENSLHPQIKAGDLFVVQFANITFQDKLTNAIGLFKSENKQSFLRLNVGLDTTDFDYEDGINPEKMDKGCLIFDVDRDTGMKVCIVDKSNKSSEASFWKDEFLELKPCKDEFHQTKEFLNITKTFITKQFPEEFEVEKTDQIDLLNRSVDYFKKHEAFDKAEFEQEVLQDEKLIKSFQNFDTDYRERHEIVLDDQFEISGQAVKKQAKVFKSVLKLDKNFHIYIHGDRQLIEKGTDADGRKFYKIYFEEEL